MKDGSGGKARRGRMVSLFERMFVPTDAAGSEVLGKVLERYPLERIAERAA